MDNKQYYELVRAEDELPEPFKVVATKILPEDYGARKDWELHWSFVDKEGKWNSVGNPVSIEWLKPVSTLPIEAIEKIVEENFKGLRDCIEDKGIAEWYIDVIKTMMEHYTSLTPNQPLNTKQEKLLFITNNNKQMTEQEKGCLLIWCGALHDIAEKAKDHYSRKQVADIRINIENLVLKSKTTTT